MHWRKMFRLAKVENYLKPIKTFLVTDYDEIWNNRKTRVAISLVQVKLIPQ